MPVLEDVPVARPHAPEARMRVGELHRRRRRESLDQLRHELSVLFPPETGCAEGAGRRLDLPLRPGQAIDGQIAQQRTANRSGRRRVQLPFAQGQAQTAGQMRQELRRLHAAPKTRVLRGQHRQAVQNGPTSPVVTQRSWNHGFYLYHGSFGTPTRAFPDMLLVAKRPRRNRAADRTRSAAGSSTHRRFSRRRQIDRSSRVCLHGRPAGGGGSARLSRAVTACGAVARSPAGARRLLCCPRLAPVEAPTAAA